MPSQPHFADGLAAAVKQRGNPVVVGLDPRWESLPAGLRSDSDDSYDAKAHAFTKFCHEIIDVVAPSCLP